MAFQVVFSIDQIFDPDQAFESYYLRSVLGFLANNEYSSVETRKPILLTHTTHLYLYLYMILYDIFAFVHIISVF